MDYVPSSSGCEPTPCLHPALPDEGRGLRWFRQNQATNNNQTSGLRHRHQVNRSQIVKAKNNNNINNVVVEMVERAKRGSLWRRLQFRSSSP
jgi:hypothetical protein